MDPVLVEWVNLALRWLHLIAGIAWIGASFYFIHLDASLKNPGGLPKGVYGESWQVHGGGFYRMQKYTVAPPELPEELIWFKWEAYTTWLSGFALLIVLYYWNAELFLIDREVMDLEPWQAVTIGVVSVAVGYAIYEGLCRSPLGRNDALLALVGCVLLVLAAWGYTRVFSGRGAYIHVGALIGTCMVASVAHVIIPNQRKVVADLIAGRTPDPRLGEQARQRSLHNNYLTLPVLFIMISNHYPQTFATRWNWLIIAVILVVGFAIRHFYNVRHRGEGNPWWTWGVAAAGMLLVVWLAGWRPAGEGEARAAPVEFAAVEEIVLGRCSMCHAAEPVWEGVPHAPKNVMLDTPELIRKHAAEIRNQAVLSHAMPPGNVTMITDEERAALGGWIAAGAPIGDGAGP
jgi:uncharacterized membrane protein